MKKRGIIAGGIIVVLLVVFGLVLPVKSKTVYCVEPKNFHVLFGQYDDYNNEIEAAEIMSQLYDCPGVTYRLFL